MQLTLNLLFAPAPPVKTIFQNNTWLNAGWATACLGFTKDVEISQSLSDALKPHHADDEDDHDQQLYDALWMAHHYLVLDQRPNRITCSLSSTCRRRLVSISLPLYLSSCRKSKVKEKEGR